MASDAKEGKSSMNLRLAFACFYLLVWYTYSLIEAVIWIFSLIASVFSALRHRPVVLTSLRSGPGSLSVLPSHLALSFDSDDLAIDDAAEITSWCIALKIPTLTLFDQKGPPRAR